MAHALSRGAKRLVLGLGGSATNDDGCDGRWTAYR